MRLVRSKIIIIILTCCCGSSWWWWWRRLFDQFSCFHDLHIWWWLIALKMWVVHHSIRCLGLYPDSPFGHFSGLEPDNQLFLLFFMSATPLSLFVYVTITFYTGRTAKRINNLLIAIKSSTPFGRNRGLSLLLSLEIHRKMPVPSTEDWRLFTTMWRYN